MKYPKDKTAIVLVDPYNDFLSKWGKGWPLVKLVAKDVNLLENLSAVVRVGRELKIPIAYAPHHRYKKGSLAGRKYLHPTQVGTEMLNFFSANKFGGDYYHELRPATGDIVASEHLCSSGFAGTNLHEELSKRGISHIVLIGMITNSCIEATARSALDLDYHVTLVTDGVAAFSPREHAATIEHNYPLIGHVVTDTQRLIPSLEAMR